MAEQPLRPAPRPVDAIIFDLDGTLIDSKEDIARSVNHTLRTLGLPNLNPDVIVDFIGRGVTSLLKDSLQRSGEVSASSNGDLLEKGRSVFLEYYGEHRVDYTTLYPGVRDILRSFSDKKLAVLSNKPEGLSQKILDDLGVGHFFVRIFGGDSLPVRKPDPQSLLGAIQRIGADTGRTAFVGDSPVDLQTGLGTGVYTVGVTYGLGRREELSAFKGIPLVEKIEDLSQYLV